MKERMTDVGERLAVLTSLFFGGLGLTFLCGSGYLAISGPQINAESVHRFLVPVLLYAGASVMVLCLCRKMKWALGACVYMSLILFAARYDAVAMMGGLLVANAVSSIGIGAFFLDAQKRFSDQRHSGWLGQH